MPRASLPSGLKNIKSFEVLLTQTTVEDVWNTLLGKFKQYEKKFDSFMMKASNQFGELLDHNPYEDVSRIERNLEYSWLDENNASDFFAIGVLYRDFMLCDKLLMWNENKPDFNDVIYQLERFNSYMATTQKDIELLEQTYYAKVINKRKKERDDKEAAERINNPHKFHKSIHFYDIQFALNPDSKLWRDGVELERYNMVKACSKCQEAERIRIENETPDTETDSEPETKSKPKEKVWFCKDCNSHSRTQLEWDNHLQTNKHLRKTEGNTNFVCEPCGYKTLLKHHWEQHCETQKHKDKSQE